MNEYVFDREDIEYLRNIEKALEKGKYAENLVLRVFQYEFLKHLKSVSSIKGSMDLYDPVMKVRIEVKAYANDTRWSDNEKFINDITYNETDNAYIYINLLSENLKSRINGNVFIINGLTLTKETFELVKNSIYSICNSGGVTSSKLTRHYLRNAKVLLNLEEDYLFNEFKLMIPKVINKYLESMTNNNDSNIYQNSFKIDELETNEVNDETNEVNIETNEVNEESNEVNVETDEVNDETNEVNVETDEVNVETILNELVSKYNQQLSDGISKVEFKSIFHNYCSTNNFKNITDKDLECYMGKICHKDVRVSDTDKRRAYRLLKPGVVNFISDEFYEKDLDKITITDEELIKPTFLDASVESTGLNKQKITPKDVLIIHKSYYKHSNNIPTRKTYLLYKDVKMNLGRQLEYIRSTYRKLYDMINETCYDFNLCVDMKNVTKYVISKIQYAVDQNIKFADIKLKTSTKGTETTLFNVLQKISQDSTIRRNTVISTLFQNINYIIDVITKNEIKIYSNELHKDHTNHTCLLFYKRTTN